MTAEATSTFTSRSTCRSICRIIWNCWPIGMITNDSAAQGMMW